MDRSKQVEKIAKRIYLIICDMADIGEDYSLLLRQYNEMIEQYNLPCKKIRWITVEKFEEYE